MRERITPSSFAAGEDKVDRYEPIQTNLAEIEGQINAGDISVMGRIDMIMDQLTSPEPTMNLTESETRDAMLHLADLIELAIAKNVIVGEEKDKYASYLKGLRS